MTTDFIVLAVVASTLFLVEIVIRHQREMPVDAREPSVSATVGVLGYSMKAVVEQLALLAVNFWVADHLAPWRLPFSNPLTWVAYFVVGDFVCYWIHQAEHRVRILWASHLVHHSAEDFGFTTTVRLSPAEVFYKPFTGLWAPLLGFPPAIYAPMAVLSLVSGQLQHTEVVGRLECSTAGSLLRRTIGSITAATSGTSTRTSEVRRCSGTTCSARTSPRPSRSSTDRRKHSLPAE